MARGEKTILRAYFVKAFESLFHWRQKWPTEMRVDHRSVQQLENGLHADFLTFGLYAFYWNNYLIIINYIKFMRLRTMIVLLNGNWKILYSAKFSMTYALYVLFVFCCMLDTYIKPKWMLSLLPWLHLSSNV